MRDYVLMTDSCCDLTDYMARELELEVLPLTMHMDGQDYPNDLAGTAISNEEFYKRIRAGKLAHLGSERGPVSGCHAPGTAEREGHRLRVLLLGAVHHLSIRRHRR